MLYDLIGFTVLVIVVWRTRELGSVTAVGLIATIINFIFYPGGTQFFNFTIASTAFDMSAWLIGYNNIFRKRVQTIISMIVLSTLSAAVAAFIIATLFMTVARAVAPLSSELDEIIACASLFRDSKRLGQQQGHRTWSRRK